MPFLQLRVVIWKNLIIRKRHWLLTIFEALLPIFVFLLLAVVRSKVSGLNKKAVTEVTYTERLPILYNGLDVEQTHLYYSPNNEFYQDIIKRIQIKFAMYNNNIHGFDTSQDLLNYYAKYHNDTVIAIVFKGNDKKKLDYTIRWHCQNDYENLDTLHMYVPLYQFQPGIGTRYHYKNLLAIQHALDMSFIEKISGKENNVTLFVQEFPYPPHFEDTAIYSMFMTYLPLLTMFSFIFLCPAVLQRVVEEKHSGIKELMKMVGMKSWMLWLGWFIYGMIPKLFAVIFVVLLLKVPFFGSEYPPIDYTDGSVLFVFLFLYCASSIVFCFAISSLFTKPTIALITGILIWIVSYLIPKYALGLDESDIQFSWFGGMILNLLPNMALHFGYLAISSFEQREIGVQWNNISKSSSGGTDDISMLNVFTMLILNSIIYMIFTFYMDGINPGKYGVRKGLLFPVHSLFKLVRKSTNTDLEECKESIHLEHVEEGSGMKKGIEIRNLSKRFGHKSAVHNLNLNIYQNQISVLLGHNGAGKTTTMSMITGMIDSTTGHIRMNGKDIKDNMNDMRKSLGLCPQHNLLFRDLTVGEHLQFFAMLKGKTRQEAKNEMHFLLKKLNLSEKINDLANKLSGGMKRKLCLGMAIIGGSNILILDEPTSGMDPESRRELWDLLLSWRSEKTILITTHFMEEADALGDWIAIMANGTLQCCGTPMYLKKKYSTGYHLSLIVKGSATREDQDKIKSNILNVIKDAQFKDVNGNNMVFVLPFENNMMIADLLSSLENNKDALKIENISVTVTTLEDVFIKAKLEHETETDSAADFDSNDSDSRIYQQRSCWLMTSTLFKKKWHFFRKKILTFLVLSLIALIFFILTVYLSGNVNTFGNSGPELKFQLDTYKKSLTFYNGTENGLIDRMLYYYKDLVESSRSRALGVKDVQKEIINEAKENILYYREHMIASAEFESGPTVYATALYNAIAVHSAPISLNIITNAIAKAYLGEDYLITTSFWPLESIDSDTMGEYSEMKIGILWLIMLPIGALFIVSSFIMFPHVEVSTKFKQLQYMCGVHPGWYWITNFFADMFLYMLIVICLAALMTWSPFINVTELGVLILLLSLYGAAGIPFAYLFSRKQSVYAAFAIFIIVGIFTGVTFTLIVGLLLQSGDDYYKNIGEVLLKILMLVLPQFGFTYSIINFSIKAVKNYNMNIMPSGKYISSCSFDPNPCCLGNTPECEALKSYWPILQINLLWMSLSCLMYLGINVLLDLYFIKRHLSLLKYKISKIWYTYRGKTAKVEASYQQDESSSSNYNTLNAKNLHKTYSGKEIVKNVGFTLNNGQCLGILGVNGAGKTTTFRMLTREEVVDAGVVGIMDNERSIDINTNEYLENLGYCPQADALNFVLTGRQILTVIAQLRGVNNPEEVDLFLKVFELEKYADIPCGHYSGGNKRKLSLAVALIGYPKYVLLDEPTNGVDPASRRKFWNLIKTVQEKKKLSFILTSHSMLECEALCNDLKIMKDGEFKKEGTISELKREFDGFNIKLKLRSKERDPKSMLKFSVEDNSTLNDLECYDEVDSVPFIAEGEIPKFNNIDELKAHFSDVYGCEIKDEHSGMIHLYVQGKMKTWSSIFQYVEKIKQENDHLIEDYSISEASLEDIFLLVARSNENSKDKESLRESSKIKSKNAEGGTPSTAVNMV